MITKNGKAFIFLDEEKNKKNKDMKDELKKIKNVNISSLTKKQLENALRVVLKKLNRINANDEVI